ncbi:DUF2147 domain-containing protein [Bradyrhizobium sp. INPA01-394B]|uniref:DUF2147 domain-containing protein n=2 Tax=Pseudomonadota TaxID=1224 RepID=A0ABR7U2S9_9BRAD|nr:DUF2147 domain-containing protein [Bradyrhizobium campsiandrae]MBC9877936.1 DUF2147 domain-containing protein [Bradyrhizobium campsiandrae]MBC9978280.1 DUF2147 domain-containing protein [Bradyrhizobium campsiandrae]
MRSTLVRHVLAALLSISPLGDAKAATASDPAGVWLTQSGDAKVKVSRCGSALCGRVVWLKEPIDKKTGKPQLDDHNSDPALRGRKIIGISLFIDMQAAGANKWSGRIYNADDGKTYVSTVTLLPSGHLSVQGCMGTLCAGEDWTR